MPTATRTPTPGGAPGRLARVPGVELFVEGTRGGKSYTAGDIDDLARNARDFGHLVRPPVKLGHGEKQLVAEALRRGLDPRKAAEEATGVPRIGGVDWTTAAAVTRPCKVCAGRGRVDGQRCPDCQGKGRVRVLTADLHEVHPAVARLIENRAYNGVSSEIYDRPPEGVPGKGKTLRAVALQGGDLPVVKSLAELPDPVDVFTQAPRRAYVRLSEARPGRDGVWHCYSEVAAMPAARHQEAPMRHEYLKKLAEQGMSPAILDEMPDHHLAEMCRVHAETPGEPDYDQEPPDVDQGQMSQYAEKARKMRAYAEKMLKKYAEGSPSPSSTMTDPDELAQGNFSELAVRLKGELLKELAPVAAQLKGVRQEAKRERITAELRKYSEQGRIDPADLDAGPDGTLPTLVDELMLLSDQPVHKFSEGGKAVQLSDLDLALRRIGKRTPRKLGEVVRGNPQAAADAQQQGVEQHYDAFSETFQRLGTTKEDFVKAFQAARKQNPDLTAEQFLHVRPR